MGLAWHPSVMRPSPHHLVLALALAVVGGMAPVPAGLPLPAAPAVARAVEPDFPAAMSGYHNWLELVAEIQQVALDHPDIVQLVSIGRSWQGRNIWMAKVSDNAATDEAEPEVLIDALHHAREHLSTEQALATLHWLVDGYGPDAQVTDLVDTREIFIVFALNPDGMRYDLTGRPFRAWRKNLQRTATGVAIFTDLNRNYGWHWGCCGGSSSDRNQITFRGLRPWSAPETRAIRDFVNSRVIDGVQQITVHITLHTNGRLVLWPYGYTKTNVPPDMTALDQRVFVALGTAMAARNGYTPEQSSDLYITDGDQIDWMYGVHRIFSFTFELYPGETATVWGDHYPDDSKIAPATARNRSAILYLIAQAACPYAVLGASTEAIDCGPLYDNLEINRGWTVNPLGTDTATGGAWMVGDPAASADATGPRQLNAAWSGIGALVTGAAAGIAAGANDVDGSTTIRSRTITLPADPAAYGSLLFRYTFAHDAAATADDALRVMVETGDGTRTTVFEQLGTPGVARDAAWTPAVVDLSGFAGQAIRLVVEATDGGDDGVVEAALDDIRIRRP